MAIGRIAYPGFSEAVEISNRYVKHNNIKSINIIGTGTGNTIDKDDVINGQLEYNDRRELVREYYTGKTAHYFLIETQSKPFVISIENLGGSAITDGFLKQSVTGYTWDSISTELDAIFSGGNLTINNCKIIQVVGDYYPSGVLLLLKIVCSTDTVVAVQAL